MHILPLDYVAFVDCTLVIKLFVTLQVGCCTVTVLLVSCLWVIQFINDVEVLLKTFESGQKLVLYLER